MSITGPGSITAANLAAQANMFNQLNTLSQQLGTGDASQTYSGLGSQADVAVSLGAQLSAIGGYSTTGTTVGTTLTLAQSVLTQLNTAGGSVLQSINQEPAFSLNGNGQTATQQSAAGYLDQRADWWIGWKSSARAKTICRTLTYAFLWEPSPALAA